MAGLKEFKWTKKRYKIAKMLADGKSYAQVAEWAKLAVVTIKDLMYNYPEFHKYVDELTLEHELITRAGASRMLLNIIEEKFEKAPEDKDTLLAYIKFLQEMKDKETADKTVTDLKVIFE